MRPAPLAAAVFLLLLFASAFWVYPLLPAKIAVHWNAQGQADGFAPKSTALALLPLITFFIALILFALPEWKETKKIIQAMQREYELFALIFILFFCHIYLLSVLWNLGFAFNFLTAMIPGLAILFYVMGKMLEKTPPNYFIGIRTPWTLKNTKAWKKVHVHAGKRFRGAAIVMLLGVIIPNYAILFVLVPLLGVALESIWFSYKIRNEK